LIFSQSGFCLFLVSSFIVSSFLSFTTTKVSKI
jgi:hypothetical protein